MNTTTEINLSYLTSIRRRINAFMPSVTLYVICIYYIISYTRALHMEKEKLRPESRWWPVALRHSL